MTAFAAGGVIWITGLSGSGKTTVAGLLGQRLRAEGIEPIVLDGDRLRGILPVRLGHSPPERRGLGRFYGGLAKEIADQGNLVICATISLFHEVHDWNRANIANYLEVWLRVPVAELRTRAGRAALYRDGENVVGADIEPEFPVRPDLVVANHSPWTARMAADAIRTALDHHGELVEGRSA